MQITIELPDTTTALGLFMNIRKPADGELFTTNWLTKPKDGLVISVNPQTIKIKERTKQNDL